jgi:hypothetical protein
MIVCPWVNKVTERERRTNCPPQGPLNGKRSILNSDIVILKNALGSVLKKD